METFVLGIQAVDDRRLSSTRCMMFKAAKRSYATYTNVSGKRKKQTMEQLIKTWEIYGQDLNW